ncbi:glycosyltransferase family 2 protein [Paenibacillus apiarius]|uniref:glycosyltransferase family 2 protein n=1 Tax=Paenibacillus apiarius TaxID=46240 RepID=UPI003B3A5DB1
MSASPFGIVIPVMNQMEVTRECIAHIRSHSCGQLPILIVDNGSRAEYMDELRSLSDYYIRNEENIGVIPAMDQAWQVLDTPYIMYLHNDLFILEPEFDVRVNRILTEVPFVGVAGFGGAHSVNCVGVRTSFTSNLVDAESHGTRLLEDYAPSVVLDGMCLIVRKELIQLIGGLVNHFSIHHYYDMDICLEAIYRGYKVLTIGVPIHHLGSRTASQPEYAAWLGNKGLTDWDLFEMNRNRFVSKWGARQFVVVDSQFNYCDAHGPIYMKTT